MTKHAVVIAGAGPTGLMLAGELALARVDVAVVERRKNQDLAGSRAGGLHSRTIEVLDQRGIAERFLTQGQVAQVAGLVAMSPLDISDFPTRHNYGLALRQNRIEHILAAWVGDLGVRIYRGGAVTGFAQDDSGVVVNGTSPESLLDTYHAERHPIGARVLRTTMVATALNRGDERMNALRETVSELLQIDEGRKRYAAMLSGLDIHYDLGAGHPLLGRRMPDLDLVTRSGTRRVFALLHDARPVLLNLGEPSALDIAGWADRVQRVDAGYAGAWELPVLGRVGAPTAVLIRPDGYVAWVGEGTDQGLCEALTTWFGPPAPP